RNLCRQRWQGLRKKTERGVTIWLAKRLQAQALDLPLVEFHVYRGPFAGGAAERRMPFVKHDEHYRRSAFRAARRPSGLKHRFGRSGGSAGDCRLESLLTRTYV